MKILSAYMKRGLAFLADTNENWGSSLGGLGNPIKMAGVRGRGLEPNGARISAINTTAMEPTSLASLS